MSLFYLNLLRLVTFLPIFAIAAEPEPPQRFNVCQTLKSKFPARISFPTDQVYTQSLESYYSGQERALHPRCIFKPTNTAEVSTFIRTITQGQYGKAAAPFAIRGGGHTLFGGAANVDGGVTVDMRAMNNVALSADKKVAHIGGGSVFSEVYPQIVPYNRTVMGGRVPGIAVGGFTTGGGVNFLSREHGWSCDNIYGYEVVLASGQVVYATAALYSDLWLALKGGSNNFGIITRFDLAAFEQGIMWGGVINFNYTKEVIASQAKAFSDFMTPKNFDNAADVGIILGFANNTFHVGDSLFYTKPIANPPVFKQFLDIPSLPGNTLSLDNVANTVTSFGRFLPDKLSRGTELVYSFHNSDVALYSQLISTWESGTKVLAHIPGIQLQYLIQPQPVTNGTNSLGLTPGQTDIVLCVITGAYANAADDAAVLKQLQSIVSQHESILRRKGLYIPYKYMNYADITQDVIGSYGHRNKARLQDVSRKYDPNGLFQTGVPGGFKLFT
ncbi:MAG: hypothetical protein Q9201_003585 [Fulgogasparrea decipioides]